MNRSIFKFIGYLLGGAAIGFAYQHFIGCRTGSCPITSNPYISTAYGALIGLVSFGGWKSAQPAPTNSPQDTEKGRVDV